MDLKWIVIPLIAFFTLGIVSTTYVHENSVYPEHNVIYNSNVYEARERVSIKGVNLNVEFVRGNNIYISHIEKVELRGDSIYIDTPKFPFRSEVTIEIGRDYNYEEIDISGVRINLNGEVRTDEFDINGTGININSTIDSEDIDISGTGIDVRGLINTEKLNISGTGINLRFKTEFLEKMVVSSTGVNGNIIFLENWRGDTKISVSSLGGDIDFEIPSGARNYLDVNTSGNVRTNTKYY